MNGNFSWLNFRNFNFNQKISKHEKSIFIYSSSFPAGIWIF